MTRFTSQSRRSWVKNRLGTSPLETRLPLTPRGGSRMKASALESSVTAVHAYPPNQLPSRRGVDRGFFEETSRRSSGVPCLSRKSRSSDARGWLTNVDRQYRQTCVSLGKQYEISLTSASTMNGTILIRISGDNPCLVVWFGDNHVGLVTDAWRLQSR